MTIEELITLESDRATAARELDRLTAARSAAILELVDANVSQREIAAALGIGKSRVSQLVASARGGVAA